MITRPQTEQLYLLLIQYQDDLRDTIEKSDDEMVKEILTNVKKKTKRLRKELEYLR